MSRSEILPSYIIDINAIIKEVKKHIITESYMSFYGLHVDIILPVYESFEENIGSRFVWLLDNKIYKSNKSHFVESLVHTEKSGSENYYIYDRFKADSNSHRKSYKQLIYKVPYVDSTLEPIYLPVYWRVN